MSNNNETLNETQNEKTLNKNSSQNKINTTNHQKTFSRTSYSQPTWVNVSNSSAITNITANNQT